MSNPLKTQIRLEGYRIWIHPESTDKLRCSTTLKIVDSNLPTESIKKFLNELEDNYWLRFKEFGDSDLPVGKPAYFDIDFNTYSFSALTRMYLVLKNDTTRFSHCEELLIAITATMGFRIKHVPRRIKKKVLKVLNDPLFYMLTETAMASSLPLDTWSRTI